MFMAEAWVEGYYYISADCQARKKCTHCLSFTVLRNAKKNIGCWFYGASGFIIAGQ